MRAGIDDGFLMLIIDGVPVYERLDQLSGLGPDVSTIESLNVTITWICAGGDMATRPVA